ncbi:MAG: hypothetical protein E6H66_14825 [Betaproteobacteria bacterium]|nr:MAG: hypothetical protein E6H66_14825 [Betaproteobacteria bacterium]
MRERTLITERRYFGLGAIEFRAASARVLARVAGLPRDRVRVSARSLRQDFAMNTLVGGAFVDGLVADGLLEVESEGRHDYRLTDRFVEFATARVVEPLTRQRARELLARASRLAARINVEWPKNPLEIEALASYGSYMSRDAVLSELSLGIVVRSRHVSRRARWGRMMTNAEGAREIRSAFRDLSSFVRVHLVNELRQLRRPFAVAFEDK